MASLMGRGETGPASLASAVQEEALREFVLVSTNDASAPLALVQKLFEIERPINDRVKAKEIDRDEQL
jgi:hypothetical protein